jgi:hypothetical protein
VNVVVLLNGCKCETALYVHSIRVQFESYSWYQPSSVAPECLASEVIESSALCNLWKKVFDVMDDEIVWFNRLKWLISKVNVVVLLNGCKCKFSFGHESTLNVTRPSMWLGPPCSFYPSLIWVILMVSMHMKNVQIGGRMCPVHEF